jgi:hypothetical protein
MSSRGSLTPPTPVVKYFHRKEPLIILPYLGKQHHLEQELDGFSKQLRDGVKACTGNLPPVSALPAAYRCQRTVDRPGRPLTSAHPEPVEGPAYVVAVVGATFRSPASALPADM